MLVVGGFDFVPRTERGERKQRIRACRRRRLRETFMLPFRRS